MKSRAQIAFEAYEQLYPIKQSWSTLTRQQQDQWQFVAESLEGPSQRGPIRVMAFEYDSTNIVLIGERAWVGRKYHADGNEVLVRAITESGLLTVVNPMDNAAPRTDASVTDGREGSIEPTI